MRKIIHIDMDAFFASVEQRDFPEYRGKPLVVGGPPDKRGVVATCSYEARKFGIHSAMPSSRAYQLCPAAIFVSPRFDAYKEASDEIRKIFNSYTELVEPLSLDEAYLDVSDCTQCKGSASLIAQEIKQKIVAATRLTASAGVSYNKFLAKVASDMNKPDGITVILPAQGEEFVKSLPVGKFYGIGKVTEARMKSLGINTGADLKKMTQQELTHYFGKAGAYYYQICRGVDDREVASHRERKSLGSETTFEKDLDNVADMLDVLNNIAHQLAESVRDKHLFATTLTLKVKYANFQQVTRSKTQQYTYEDVSDIWPVVLELMDKTEVEDRPVRLLGLSLSNFKQKNEIPFQSDLFS